MIFFLFFSTILLTGSQKLLLHGSVPLECSSRKVLFCGNTINKKRFEPTGPHLLNKDNTSKRFANPGPESFASTTRLYFEICCHLDPFLFYPDPGSGLVGKDPDPDPIFR